MTDHEHRFHDTLRDVFYPSSTLYYLCSFLPLYLADGSRTQEQILVTFNILET